MIFPLVSLVALALALLFIMFARMPLIRFLALDAVIAAVVVVVKSMNRVDPNTIIPDVVIPSVAIFAGALLIVVLMVGLLGTRISQSNYQALLAVLSLFPWFASNVLSIDFIIAAVLILAAHSWFKQGSAFKQIGHRRMSLAMARRKLSKDEYAVLAKKGSVTFAPSLLIGLVVASLATIGMV